MPKKHERTEEESNDRSTKTARGLNTGDAVSTSAGSTSSSASSSSSSGDVQDDTPASLAEARAQRGNIFINEFSKDCPFVLRRLNYYTYKKDFLPKFITILSDNTAGINLTWLNDIFANIVNNLNSLSMTNEQLTLLVTSVENIIARLAEKNCTELVKSIICLLYLLSRCMIDGNKIELYNKLCESSKLNESVPAAKIIWKILLKLPLIEDDICDAEESIASLKVNKGYGMTWLWITAIFCADLSRLTAALASNKNILTNPKLDKGLPWMAFQIAALYGNSEFYRAVFVYQSHAMSNINKLYFKAISKRDMRIINHLLAIFPSLWYAKDSEGYGLLHTAAKNGYLDLVNYFLNLPNKSQNEQNVSVDEAWKFELWNVYSSREVIYATQAEARINDFNNKGDTPLHLAASAGLLEMVKFLIKAGARINIENDKGDTPLQLAALNCHYDVIVEIISSTPTSILGYINCPLTGLLFWAAKNGHLVTVQKLIQEGVKLSKVDHYEGDLTETVWDTVLHVAAKAGQLDIVRYLIGVDKTLLNKVAQYGMPLHSAAANGHLEVVKLLIEAGAEPLARDRFHYTALHSAVEGGHQDVVEYLFKSYHFKKEPKTKDGETILHLAAKYGHLELVKLFLARGANIALATRAKKTAFSFAAENGHLHVVTYLLDVIHGLNWAPEQRHNCLSNAFNLALCNRHFDIAEKLFELDATVISEFIKDGKKVFTSLSDRKEIIQFLLMEGVNAYELSNFYKQYHERYSFLYDLLLSGIAVIDTPEINPGLVRGLKSMLGNVQSTNVDVSQLSLVGMLLFSPSDFRRQVNPDQTNVKLSEDLSNWSNKIGFPPYVDAFGNNHLDNALKGEEASIQFLARIREPEQTILVNSLLQLADIQNDTNPKKAELIALHGRLAAIRKTQINTLVGTEVLQTVTCSSSSSVMFANPGPSSAAASSNLSVHGPSSVAASSNLSIHESAGTSSTPSSSLPAGPSVTVSSSSSMFTSHASGAASSLSSSSESSSSSLPRESSRSLPPPA